MPAPIIGVATFNDEGNSSIYIPSAVSGKVRLRLRTRLVEVRHSVRYIQQFDQVKWHHHLLEKAHSRFEAVHSSDTDRVQPLRSLSRRSGLQVHLPLTNVKVTSLTMHI